MRTRPGSREFAVASGAVEAMLSSQDLAQTLRPHMAKVKWAEVVGPQVAAVTQPTAVRGGGILVVRVKNSVWANELILLKDDMLRRLNLALGGRVLTDIHFQASGLPRAKPGASAAPRPLLPPLPREEELAAVTILPETLIRIAGVVSSIEDNTLRDRVRNSLLRAARYDAWKQAQGWQPCLRCGTLTPEYAGSALCPVCRAQTVPT